MRWRYAVIVALISLAGCATAQLNHNALDLSTSLDMLTTQQILHNLNQTLMDPYAVPSQAEVSAGTVTTTNSLSPSFSIPLNTSSVVTTGAQTGASLTKTDTTATTHPNTGLTLGGTNSWSQGWTLNPASDPDQIRRLRALYRFATGKMPDDTMSFQCEYPVQAISSEPPPAGTTPQRLICNEPNKTIELSVVYDPNFTRYPSCVICKSTAVVPASTADSYKDTAGRNVRDSYYINPELVHGFVTNSPKDKSQYQSLSSYGYPDLFVCLSARQTECNVDGMKALHNFVLFVSEANGQQSAAAGGSKSPSMKALGAPIILTPVQ